MAFANTNSIAAADMNNLLRGLHRNNANSAHTGSTAETDLSSFAITGGTIGSTGMLIVEAAGTITGSAGNKTIKMKFGSTTLSDTGAGTGAFDWWLRVAITNTATNAQRVLMTLSDHTSSGDFLMDYITASEDTTASVTVKVTGQLTNAADTITQTMFNIYVIQIT